jgi:hypothetical protein
MSVCKYDNCVKLNKTTRIAPLTGGRNSRALGGLAKARTGRRSASRTMWSRQANHVTLAAKNGQETTVATEEQK